MIDDAMDILLKGVIPFNKYKIINFTALNSEDKLEILKWRNHENIRKWMFNDNVIKESGHLNFIENLKCDRKNYYWRLSGERDYGLGVISINKIDTVNKNAYLGIYKNPYIESGRTGTFLIKALFYIAFEKLKLHTLKLEVTSDNRRAINFYLEKGFREEGRLREFLQKNERRADVIVMGIISTEADYESI